MRIGFIGNFRPSFSTENDRKWSFERLGHEVITYQEDKTSIGDISDDLDVLFYSHTHGWKIEGLGKLFLRFRNAGIPTASVHLDRWAWLSRVSDVGTEATWYTEYIFMADGSPEAVELYEKHNLNWHYIAPGVVERDCYKAKPRTDRFPHEIIFVGSRGYHPEYPERPKIIDFLKTHYGSRFGHYGADGLGTTRGGDLNELYASAKIAVGDSCFGGRPRYVSDRYFETRGRGGFLLHPHVEGVDTHGVVNYRDLEELTAKIDYYLEHEEQAQRLRDIGFNHVKEHETYTNRAQEILDIIFGG